MADYQGSRNGAVQNIAYTSSSVGIATSLGSQTYHIRLSSTSACYYKVGPTAQTATSTDVFLPPSWVEVVRVQPGNFVAAIKSPTSGSFTSADGVLNVTELSH